MDQLSDFKNEESHLVGEALRSTSTTLKSQVNLQIDPEIIVQQILTDLLPYIASHGGHVELVRIQDSIVFIRFSGACVQCPLSFYTVTYGIERHIKVKLPWIIRVDVVED